LGSGRALHDGGLSETDDQSLKSQSKLKSGYQARLLISESMVTQDPTSEKIPLHCMTSPLARTLLSVEAGCDPNGNYIEQSLLIPKDVIETFWKNHGNSWGQTVIDALSGPIA